MSIDTLCDWGERMQPTPLQLQVGRVYIKQGEAMPFDDVTHCLKLLIESMLFTFYHSQSTTRIADD
ncbi:hypothetical protein DDN75_16975 [Vibrio cholerae]|nr:hypothetical protein [Vibrio cholerae]